MSLSISKAWDETRALFASDGRLFSIVALALVGVPTMISGLIDPESATGAATRGPGLIDVLVLLFALVALVGQLSLVRLALKPSVTVGAAIAHGARRMPVYLVTAILIGLGLLVLFIPLGVMAVSSGIEIDRTMSNFTNTMWMMVLILCVIVIFFGVRLMMGTPVASAEQAGPVEIIKRSWVLTQGVWWKLFVFLLMLMIAAIIVLMAVGFVVGSVVTIAFGPIEAMTPSALAVGLLQGLFNAAFTAVFAVMLARIYVQLSGRDTVEAPKIGT